MKGYIRRKFYRSVFCFLDKLDDVTVEFEFTGAHKDLCNDTIVATAFV